jgi:hypothetical protein
MQLYWIPVMTACFSLLVASAKGMRRSSSIARALTCVTVVGVACLIALYQGVNSDWQTYRSFVENCDELRCTYFEPGYDFLTFLSSITFGFSLFKILLIACFIGSVAVAVRGTSNPTVVILAVASISIATLPLMLGAIRQALTLPLLLSAAFLLEERRYRLALLATAIAGSIHYSALVAGLWYGLMWHVLARKPRPPRVGTAMLLVGTLVSVTYMFLLALSNSGLGDAVSLVARIGETGAGTDFITTGGPGRDLAILVERIPFAVVALVLFVRQTQLLSRTERVFLLMYVAGSAFFLGTFIFDRNIAGRTMATFRLADVLVIVTVVCSLAPERMKKISLPLALIVALLFVVSKSYMTMATVGFFDE